MGTYLKMPYEFNLADDLKMGFKHGTFSCYCTTDVTDKYIHM